MRQSLFCISTGLGWGKDEVDRERLLSDMGSGEGAEQAGRLDAREEAFEEALDLRLRGLGSFEGGVEGARFTMRGTKTSEVDVPDEEGALDSSLRFFGGLEKSENGEERSGGARAEDKGRFEEPAVCGGGDRRVRRVVTTTLVDGEDDAPLEGTRGAEKKERSVEAVRGLESMDGGGEEEKDDDRRARFAQIWVAVHCDPISACIVRCKHSRIAVIQLFRRRCTGPRLFHFSDLL